VKDIVPWLMGGFSHCFHKGVIMKKLSLLIYLILILLTFSPFNAQSADQPISADIEIQRTVILPFLRALADGNVNGIKKYLSTDMYTRNKRLLENNTTYSNFLKNYYSNASFSIIGSSATNGEYIFDVLVEFSDGSQNVGKIRVLKETLADVTVRDAEQWRINAMPFQ
jgi:hypothetical protein